MVKHSKKNNRKKGGMISKVASSLAHTAALEYAQRRGPKIVKHAVESPENLKDPSVYITGKKTQTEKPVSFNIDLVKPTPFKINSNSSNDENANPNRNANPNQNANPNARRGGKTKRHKKRSRKSRKIRRR